jgi:predicted TIM-barrel fold metal-dependent hydrolase
LHDFRPRPALRLPETHVPRARVPAIDAHNHLGRWLSGWVHDDGGWVAEDVGALLALMDEVNVEAIVNLDGRWGDELEANLDRYDRAHPGRFFTFCHVDWANLDGAADSLAASRGAGACGLKVWKDLGLGVTDERGEFLLPDDPRLGDLWAAAGELELPVLIHTADPVAFWDPLDATNERIEELGEHPEWSFADPHFPRWERLLDALEAVVAAHPLTSFIGAHVCSCSEDLARVERMLSAYPNLHCDPSARISELGRQPRAARRLIERHPDSVVFGTDIFPPTRAAYELHWRFFETDDEHFPYGSEDNPWPQGRWYVSALDLPEDVLARFYKGQLLETDCLEPLPCRNEHHVAGDRQPAGGLAPGCRARRRSRRPPPRSRVERLLGRLRHIALHGSGLGGAARERRPRAHRRVRRLRAPDRPPLRRARGDLPLGHHERGAPRAEPRHRAPHADDHGRAPVAGR